MKRFRDLHFLASFSLNINLNDVGVLRFIPIPLSKSWKAELPVKKSN